MMRKCPQSATATNRAHLKLGAGDVHVEHHVVLRPRAAQQPAAEVDRRHRRVGRRVPRRHEHAAEAVPRLAEAPPPPGLGGALQQPWPLPPAPVVAGDPHLRCAHPHLRRGG